MPPILYLHDIKKSNDQTSVGANKNNIDLVEDIDLFLTKNPDTKLITIDDGYKSSKNIIPLLEKHAVRCVIFITTGFTSSTRQPYEIRLSDLLSSRNKMIDLKNARHIIDNKHKKELMFQKIHNKIKPLNDKNREHYITKLMKVNNFKPPLSTSNTFLSWHEIIELNSHPLVEIGSHTISHLLLPKQNAWVIYKELRSSKRELEAKLSTPITKVSYPYGGSNVIVRMLAFFSGYKAGYSTEVTRSTNSNFIIPRISLAKAITQK